MKGIADAGGKAEFAEADVTKEASCRALIDGVAAKHGKLNILVNNAGTNVRKSPDILKLEEWRSVMDTNLTSAFMCSHAAYPHMNKAGGGKIINIGSMMSIFAASFSPAYAASKGGIVQFGALLRDRLGEGQHPGERDPAGLDQHRPDRRARGARCRG